MKYKILKKKEALEFNDKKAINKREGEIFMSALSIFDGDDDPRWQYDNAALEIIQYRKLNPLSGSRTETDRIYNEMETVLRTWVNQAAIQDTCFSEINEDFYPGEIWHPVFTEQNILKKGKIAVFDYPISEFFDGEECSKIQIVTFETTDINELPPFILSEIERDRNLVYQFAIKNHLNQYIVDKYDNLIFRFNYVYFGKHPKDFLITGKKIAKRIDPNSHLEYKIDPLHGTEILKLRKIARRYTTDTSAIKYPKTMVYYEPYDLWDPIPVPFLSFNKMYDTFSPHLNMLHSNLHNYENDTKVTTNGIFVHKPKYYGNKRNLDNMGICLFFNKFGYVFKLEGDYDAIKKYRSDIARDFRYQNELPPSEEAAKYSISGNKIRWTFYDPNNDTNMLFDEPREYIEFEGIYHEYALRLNIHVSYYNQDRRRHIREKVAEKLIFDLYEV